MVLTTVSMVRVFAVPWMELDGRASQPWEEADRHHRIRVLEFSSASTVYNVLAQWVHPQSRPAWHLNTGALVRINSENQHLWVVFSYLFLLQHARTQATFTSDDACSLHTPLQHGDRLVLARLRPLDATLSLFSMRSPWCSVAKQTTAAPCVAVDTVRPQRPSILKFSVCCRCGSDQHTLCTRKPHVWIFPTHRMPRAHDCEIPFTVEPSSSLGTVVYVNVDARRQWIVWPAWVHKTATRAGSFALDLIHQSYFTVPRHGVWHQRGATATSTTATAPDTDDVDAAVVPPGLPALLWTRP